MFIVDDDPDVRASNGDGIRDRAGITYEITQEPHFYETGWFRLVAVIAFILKLSTVKVW